MKRIKISFHNDRVGVSEIMGAILLLSISIALLSIVYLLVLHNATSPSSMSHVSSTNMVATLDDNHVYLQNNGGVPINPNIKIVITVSGNRYTLLVGNCLVDSNGDGKWSIGESLIFTPPGFASLRNLEVSVQVISPDDNTMLMSSLVQEGVRGDQPYVQTLPAHDVWPHNAVLKMYYNFVTNKYLPGKVWFQWREQSSTQWNFTAKTSITAGPITNFVDVPLYGLTSNKNYLFEACFQFNSSYTTVNVTGGILIFTTQI
ncbi:MAG TPA: type IV pilin, partial [Candidatus Thermoplasmatota archaeon]|nr:type IV pilin [Candidatus Thermoplasmatota archaeon]